MLVLRLGGRQVQRALREIIFRAGGLLALDTHRVQEKAVREIQAPLDKARRLVDEAWEALLTAETTAKKKTLSVAAAQKEFDEVRRRMAAVRSGIACGSLPCRCHVQCPGSLA